MLVTLKLQNNENNMRKFAMLAECAGHAVRGAFENQSTRMRQFGESYEFVSLRFKLYVIIVGKLLISKLE